jgi:NAD(P)H dehydrogenase (quinone)
MKALIVHVHPEPKSMNAALTAVAADTLRGEGFEVEISDLYAQGFHAVAGGGDFTQRASPERLGYVHEQRHAAASRAYAPDILAEQDKIARADWLIFQFPLWWYAVPALLKGWADRVLTHGFAYTDERLFDQGLLAGKRGMLSVTTGASADELEADRRWTGSIDEILRPFSGGVLGYVGLQVLPPFIAYAAGNVSAEGRRAQLEAYRAHLRQQAQGMRP